MLVNFVLTLLDFVKLTEYQFVVLFEDCLSCDLSLEQKVVLNLDQVLFDALLHQYVLVPKCFILF